MTMPKKKAVVKLTDGAEQRGTTWTKARPYLNLSALAAANANSSSME
jgi:hypothetical protein